MTFPPVERAWPHDSPAPGLLAWGGNLSLERLKLAYAEGIFPWFSVEDPILWWSPDPRMVLYPGQFKLSRSLRKTLRRFLHTAGCEIRINTAFRKVMTACASVERPGQDGTWIVPDIIDAYTCFHEHGYAHSFETWINGTLAGGLYGVALGGMFYGESMFAHQTDASKLALCGLIAYARFHGIKLIDCQQKTAHLASLGGGSIPRAQFVQEMKQAQQQPCAPWGSGVCDGAIWHTLLP